MSRLIVEIQEREDGSAWGEVAVHYDSEPLTPSEEVFLRALTEAHINVETMSIELNGKRYAGVRIVSITRSIS